MWHAWSVLSLSLSMVGMAMDEAKSQWKWPWGLGKKKMGFGGVSPCLGDPPNEAARPGTQHGGRSSFGHHHVLRLKMTAFGPPPTPARRRGAPRRRRRPPAELRRGGCLLPPPFLLFLLLFASSPPFSSLSFLCKLKCVNERERERVLVAWRCFVRG